MSEHTLSGVDLTNGKRVNLNFTSGDLLGTGDLFDTTKIVEDITKKKKEKEKEKSNIEKADSFVEKVEAEGPYKDLNEAKKVISKQLEGTAPKTVQEYADQNNISYNQALAELQGTPQQIGSGENAIFTYPDSKLGKVIPMEDTKLEKFFRKYDPTYESYAGAEDKELEIVNGKVVAKKRPKGFMRGLAGLGDILTFGLSDFDRQGGGIGGMATGLGYDVKDYNINISKKGKELLEKQAVDKKLEKVDISPTEGVDATKSIEEQRKQTKFDRGERLKDALQAAGINIATMPIYTRILEDAAKRRLELDKAMLGAREMMPSNIQNIMLSKQAQKQMASSAFAEELKAVADQQDAATKFAGLGMQRAFGQPNPTSFRV